ncbi:MAG: hypothetical protein WC471_03125 [Candidatus Woesearchaeota archaeon]
MKRTLFIALLIAFIIAPQAYAKTEEISGRPLSAYCAKVAGGYSPLYFSIQEDDAALHCKFSDHSDGDLRAQLCAWILAEKELGHEITIVGERMQDKKNKNKIFIVTSITIDDETYETDNKE